MALNSSMVLVLRNEPSVLNYTGPDLSCWALLKLKASTERMDSFSILLLSLNLAMSVWGCEVSL